MTYDNQVKYYFRSLLWKKLEYIIKKQTKLKRTNQLEKKEEPARKEDRDIFEQLDLQYLQQRDPYFLQS